MPINSVQTRLEVSHETLRILVNNCPALAMMDREWEDYFEQKNPIGSVLTLRRPWRPGGRKGQAFQPEGIVQTTVPLPITYWRGGDFIYNDTDEALYLNMDRFHEEYSKPLGLMIAQQIESDALQFIQLAIPNYVGTPGTMPTTLQVYNSAQTQLNKLLAPKDRAVVFNSDFNQNAVGLGSTLFNPQPEIRDQYLEGYVGKYAGMKFVIDEQLPTFTTATYAGSPVVNTAGQVGNTISIRGFTPGSTTLNPGDRLSYGGVQKVNPGGTHVKYVNQPFQQVVTAVASDSSGTLTAQVYPALIPYGGFINASASPLDGATVTIAGASNTTAQTAFAFHREAFTSAFIKLHKPSNVMAEVVGGDSMPPGMRNIYLRSIRQWQNSGQFAGYETERMDVIYGFAAPYADYMATVIYGG